MTIARNAQLTSLRSEKAKCVHTMGSSLQRIAQHAGGSALAAAAVFSLLLGGCSGPTLSQIKDQNDFDRQVLQSKQPVLVDFYKDGCPTCVILEPKLVKLAEEYQGRIAFARFKLMEAYFVVKAPQLKERYDISYFPTVILFADGQEKKRWVLKYDMDQYRTVLDEAVAQKK